MTAGAGRNTVATHLHVPEEGLAKLSGGRFVLDYRLEVRRQGRLQPAERPAGAQERAGRDQVLGLLLSGGGADQQAKVQQDAASRRERDAEQLGGASRTWTAGWLPWVTRYGAVVDGVHGKSAPCWS